jgi:hypothetical protein
VSILGLLILIVALCVIRAYVPGMPEPLPLILTIVIIILAVVLLIVVLQVVGILPGFGLLGTPVHVR